MFATGLHLSPSALLVQGAHAADLTAAAFPAHGKLWLLLVQSSGRQDSSLALEMLTCQDKMSYTRHLTQTHFLSLNDLSLLIQNSYPAV